MASKTKPKRKCNGKDKDKTIETLLKIPTFKATYKDGRKVGEKLRESLMAMKTHPDCPIVKFKYNKGPAEEVMERIRARLHQKRLELKKEAKEKTKVILEEFLGEMESQQPKFLMDQAELVISQSS